MAEAEPFTFQDPVSVEYEQALYWSIEQKPSRKVLLQLLALPLALLAGIVFPYLAARLGRFPSSFEFGLLVVPVALVGIILTVVLHELIHGTAMRLFGARPRYGAHLKSLVFYATAPGFAFRRNSYLLVALAPLVGISLLAVLGMILLQGTLWVGLCTLCAVINGAGAVGDLWMSAMVLRYPPVAYVVDERDGFRVLLPRPAQD